MSMSCDMAAAVARSRDNVNNLRPTAPHGDNQKDLLPSLRACLWASINNRPFGRAFMFITVMTIARQSTDGSTARVV